MSGELEKLKIMSFSKPDYSSDSKIGEFEVQFNPDEYSLTYDVEYDEKQGSGTTGSPMTFKSVKPQEFSIKFMIDGSGASGEAIDATEKIAEFYKIIGYDGTMHRPSYLLVNWGTLRSYCVLIKADITYKLFKPDGKPLRAMVNASFKENVDDETRVKLEQKSSPDLTHIRTVKEGDSLPGLVYGIYNDTKYYLDVARINSLDNFRALDAGTRLYFPPISKEANDN